MDDSLDVLIELNEYIWSQFKNSLADLEPRELDWKPVPQANSVSIIVRHLRIEAEWQLASLVAAEPMPSEVTAPVQTLIDSTGFDFERNLDDLELLCTRFIEALRTMSTDAIQERTRRVYRDFPAAEATPAHFLGYHHAVHLAMHSAHIRTIRNLYRTSRGQPGRFFPSNPTFPGAEST